MENKSDEKVLFPDVEVEGYTLRNWSLAQAVELAPTLGAVVGIVGDSGVSSAIAKILDAVDIDEVGMTSVVNAFRTVWKDVVKAVPGLVPKLLPYAPRILEVTLSESSEVVGRFDLGKSSRLLTAIAVQNYEYLKNYYGPEAAKESMAS